MQYFFTKIEDWKIKNERVVYQLWRVLRWKIWDKFFALNWEWKKEFYEIIWFSKKEIDVKIIHFEQKNNENSEKNIKKIINLFFWIPKSKDKFEFILQKWAELWVSNFFPIKSDFSQWKFPFKKERFELIICEACEQSERLFLAKLNDFETFENHLKKINKWALNLFFDPRWKKLKSQFDLLSEQKKSEEINLFIWPEWGFSEKELNFAKENNFQFTTLWENILRMETAVIVALWRINYLW